MNEAKVIICDGILNIAISVNSCISLKHGEYAKVHFTNKLLARSYVTIYSVPVQTFCYSTTRPLCKGGCKIVPYAESDLIIDFFRTHLHPPHPSCDGDP